MIAASIGFTPASAKVQTRYNALLHHLGPEFYILRQAPLEDISHASGPSVAEGIRRMRAGEVTLSPGYDGEYGKIHLLDEEEINTLSGQISLFGMPAPPRQSSRSRMHQSQRQGVPAQNKPKKSRRSKACSVS